MNLHNQDSPLHRESLDCRLKVRRLDELTLKGEFAGRRHKKGSVIRCRRLVAARSDERQCQQR
mgnify:CR=1 FL=1